MSEHTNTELVKYCEAQLGRGYWFATYGNIASESLYKSKRAQYPQQYDKWAKSSFTSQYGEKVHDCSGLFKGFFMTPRTDEYPNNPATYIAKYDMSADTLIKNCTETGDISTIPSIPGLVVWRSGHVGCYLGNGYVIEAKGHSYGVIRSKLSDGTWKKWGKHPYIEYVGVVEPEKKGDTVMIDLPVLKKGNKTDTTVIKNLQILLNGKGYRDQNGDKLVVDGSFGGKTQYAVQKFQANNGLSADGIVGQNTWNKLMKGNK